MRAGKATKLGAGFWVLDATLPPETLARQHRFSIVALLWPGAVISGVSALAGSEPTEGWLFITRSDHEGARSSRLEIRGLTVQPQAGPGPLPGDTPLPEGLHLSGAARRLVENWPIRGRPPVGRPSGRAGVLAVEDAIDSLARTGGAGRVQAVLDELDLIAGHFDNNCVTAVRTRLVAVLGTLSHALAPRSPRLGARLAGDAFDDQRLDRFTSIVAALGDLPPHVVNATGVSERWTWLPFFEAYFSNFIEGTEFEVDEARDIAVSGVVPAARPQDAHDVAATFRIVNDPEGRAERPTSGAEYLELLRHRHALIMAARPDKNPGLFKTRRNSAGGYGFVDPDLLVGTLSRGFDIISQLSDPLQRSTAMMFLTTECHPFDDGNGRVSRIMANAELSSAGQVRSVIPTVLRTDYLQALTGASVGAGSGESLLAVIRYGQRWASRVDWTDFERTKTQLIACNAFMDAALADREGRRLVMPD